jgi:hypothetical protein
MQRVVMPHPAASAAGIVLIPAVQLNASVLQGGNFTPRSLHKYMKTTNPKRRRRLDCKAT